MITAILINATYLIVYALTSPLRLFDDVSLSASITTAISTASGYISSFTPFFPVGTLITCLGILLTIEAAVIVYKILMWVITKIPGVGN